ncbi:MAG: glycerol-3-phosphate 1-O-acyltransferase PlsY [Rhodothermales bacterium]
MLSLAVIIVLSYLIGSIPGSILVGKLFHGIDVRNHGSGNAGATNTFRVLGWKSGVVATVIDLGKGIVAAGVISGLRIDPIPGGLGFWDANTVVSLIAGVAAVIGHMFPIWAGFKGGKGVNTTAGMLIALTPATMALTLSVFVLVLVLTRYVSVASLSAVVTYPLAIGISKYVLGSTVLDASIFVFALFLAAGLFIAHRTNIQRLMSGTENRLRTFRPGRGMHGRGEV